MKAFQRAAFVCVAVLVSVYATRVDAQGSTNPEDHYHYLHVEVEHPNPDAAYPDGPDRDNAYMNDGVEAPDEGDEIVVEGEAPLGEGPSAEEVDPDDTVPVATFDLSGWLWFNYSIQPWRDTTLGRYGNFEWNQLQLSGSASFGNFSMRFEIRFFSFMLIVRQAWLQYAWKDNQIRLGQINVPWGRHVFSSHSWWFTLGWYATVEDDYDYGISYSKDTDNYRVDVGYYFRDPVGLLEPTSRWDSDLTPLGEQQNREVSSAAIRGIYKLPHRPGLYSELGVVAQAGLLPNVATGERGYRWLAMFMYNGNYDGWEPLFQVTRHEFRPNNPAEIDGVPVDDRVVRISQFGGYRDVAAKYTLFNFNLAKTIPFGRKYFQGLVPYAEYSLFLKDAAAFPTSHLITAGLQVHLGQVWVWFDFLMGRNATYLNDSFASSALASGAARPGRFEYQPNIQIQYYF
ncbi:MAG: hypothetical protein WBG86_19705 [Polyangiales bacterium]